MQALKHAGAVLLALTLSGGSVSAEEEIWSPHDQFNEPNRDCELMAALPAPKNSLGWALVGHTCNTLNGEPVGSLVVIDVRGRRDTSPVSTALEAASDRDRMKELVQLLAVPNGGYIATYHSREASAPRGESGPTYVAHELIRHTVTGARAESFNRKVKEALADKVGASAFIISADVDAKSRLIVAASTPDEGYLKEAPLWLLRFNTDGAIERAHRFDSTLQELGLGWFVLNQVRARPDGGVFLTGRFETDGRRYPILALNSLWKPDGRFNTWILSTLEKDKVGLELSLISPRPDGTVVGVGALAQGDKRADVMRLTSDGRIDPLYKTFRQEGEYPQGRFMRLPQMGVGPDGALVLAQNYIPAVDPPEGPWRAPGLVRLRVDGTVDGRFQTGLGDGFRYRKAAEEAKRNPEVSGFLRLVAVMPDGSVLVDGLFDEFARKEVTPPIRLSSDGTRVQNFQARFETVLPPKKEAPNATTSAFFKADGKSHYIECIRPGELTETLLYWTRGDVWGHTPSCAVHLGGSMATPGGAWQHCDARVRRAQAKGATCTETKQDPLDLRRGAGGP